jgi:3-hydroxyisobutyrate dehydrogenase
LAGDGSFRSAAGNGSGGAACRCCFVARAKREVRSGVEAPCDRRLGDLAMNLQRIGIIGAGNMGGAIAHRLLDLGTEVWVRDIRPQVERPLAERGARIAENPAELVGRADATLIVVVDAAQIEDVLFNEPGAAGKALRPGAPVLLLSTIAPADAQRVALRLAAYGVVAIDAPISGGPARARDGSLSMMLAGDESAYLQLQPLLQRICGRVFRIGAQPGQAAAMKLVNNLLAGVNLAAAAEALALGRRAGLAPALMLEVIGASSGASWMLADRGARWLAGDEAPRAHLAILAKDLDLALALAAEHDLALAIGRAARRQFAEAVADGLAAVDDSTLIDRALSAKR